MILILVAVKEELSKNDLPNIQIHYTGVGKINAAIKTLKIIKNYAPSLIINYGTAGSLNKELRGLVEATRFFKEIWTLRHLDLRLVKPRLMIFQKLTLEVKDIVAEQETLF